MNILHLATQDISGGGGGFSASYRLHSNMRAQGIDSYMVVLNKESVDANIFEVASHLSLFDKIVNHLCSFIRRLIKKIFKVSIYFNFECLDVVRVNLLMKSFPVQPDVIIAHWVSKFIDASVLRELNHITGAPVVWYLMDMAAFTGGCHYAFDCVRYTSQCGNCPQLGILKSPKDMSYQQWNNKKTCFQGTNITTVSASSWLRRQVEAASVFINDCHETILLGVDSDIFSNGDQLKARNYFDLPVDYKIIFLVLRIYMRNEKALLILLAH